MEIASVANRTYDQLAGDGSHLRKRLALARDKRRK
jgi:hypothetical protein